MTSFPEREQGFEVKFAHDQEVKFKATFLRNRLLGHWAAQKLGLGGVAAESYAKGIVAVDFEAPHADAVFSKIRSDFDANGVSQSDHQIRRTMDDLMVQALTQIEKG
jgi:hypothetical protein